MESNLHLAKIVRKRKGKTISRQEDFFDKRLQHTGNHKGRICRVINIPDRYKTKSALQSPKDRNQNEDLRSSLVLNGQTIHHKLNVKVRDFLPNKNSRNLMSPVDKLFLPQNIESTFSPQTEGRFVFSSHQTRVKHSISTKFRTNTIMGLRSSNESSGNNI